MNSNPTQDTPVEVNPLLEALLAGRLHDPFSYLGARVEHDYSSVRVFYPYASNVWISAGGGFKPMTRAHPLGVFEWRSAALPPMPYLLRVQDGVAGPEAQ